MGELLSFDNRQRRGAATTVPQSPTIPDLDSMTNELLVIWALLSHESKSRVLEFLRGPGPDAHT
jgi:hypothetical protein